MINGKDVPIQLHQLQLYWPKMLNDEKSYLKAFGIYSCMLYPGHRHIHNENSMQKKKSCNKPKFPLTDIYLHLGLILVAKRH